MKERSRGGIASFALSSLRTGAGGGEDGNGSTTQVEPADGFEVKASASYPGDAAVQIDVN